MLKQTSSLLAAKNQTAASDIGTLRQLVNENKTQAEESLNEGKLVAASENLLRSLDYLQKLIKQHDLNPHASKEKREVLVAQLADGLKRYVTTTHTTHTLPILHACTHTLLCHTLPHTHIYTRAESMNPK